MQKIHIRGMSYEKSVQLWVDENDEVIVYASLCMRVQYQIGKSMDRQ